MSLSVHTLVIGGGVAGLATALKLAAHQPVTLLMKSPMRDSSSYKAQGGIAAAAADEDSVAQHIADTLTAGDGLCHQDVVELVIQEGPTAMRELLAYGVPFSRTDGGEVHLTREGGHSHRRVWHVSDATGPALMQTLMRAVRQCSAIEVLHDYVAVDFITTAQVASPHRADRCLGARVLEPSTGAVVSIRARHTVLCTGGHGRIYLYTSNPPAATGDGLAMAHRAGVRLANLEFMQFHPTCLYHSQRPNFLISEALRGEGARLVNQRGEDFMRGAAGSLGLRDEVTRAIYHELRRRGDQHVYLDVSGVAPQVWRSHFVQIAAVCESLGIQVQAGEPIPVVPCAHYSCGGVVVDHDGCTSLQGLYAVGEVACTGLHGGNRLASNSLLEAIAYAARLAGRIKAEPSSELPLEWDDDYDGEVAAAARPDGVACAYGGDAKIVLNHIGDEIRRTMWNDVGIERSRQGLEQAMRRLQALQAEVDALYERLPPSAAASEVRNMAEVATLTVTCALQRRESRGVHYMIDYPYKRALAKDTLL